ncbi:MAG: Rab family GTPase [Limnoraphis robusta]|uniref:Rab family GTPase n=1 Tax=Limnoraphis robusta CCNP1315 TaxID=3110306 RepID=A0ABU5U4S2_9CYAN|nr:Rab family GTPase [Limnoraphis robusta]MEA5498577.1 Rab family GTPase [Limnoraphis robusta BA-68 BA1]MEA5522197.1 Rab family GTPase [Limnoraphis robusta CCNP1315]MEA5538921.1 Rab family GTPase [Limnoraphis robusta Tam1]MEA5545759.1 Rab family GTPase [Limnoraphis robusta CCNP1324]
MSVISKKICLVGDFGVGKTSLIRRFVDRQFSDQYLSTVGVKISRKQVDLVATDTQSEHSIQLLIWDLEGHTKFKGITPSYLQGASGVVVVGDVTRSDTLDHIPEHIDLFLSVNPKGWIVIALNKVDLLAPESLEGLVQRSFDSKKNDKNKILSTYQTSAKTGAYVDEIFQVLSHQFISKF